LRKNGRQEEELRDVKITRNFLKYPQGSVLIEMGGTKVICTATLEGRVPPFLRNSGKGWLTAEYAMLPMATQERNQRESVRGQIGGRTHEIQRLIGRSLRAVTLLDSFGENTVYIDCDVIQADGGTRTASITGSFVALVDLFRKMKEDGKCEIMPVRDFVSAVSVGIIDGQLLLDLEYEEDSRADVDMNVVMTGAGEFIEVQGTAERVPFAQDRLTAMIEMAGRGIRKLTEIQKETLGGLI